MPASRSSRAPLGRTLSLLLLVAATLAACGGNDAAEVREAPGAVATVPAPAVRVTDVALGRAIAADRQVVEEMNDFAMRDTIYASVRTEGTGANITLTARWTFDDGQVVDESSQTIAPTGPTITEFHISQPTGLAEGNYTVTILLNGAEVESEDFAVTG